MFIGWTFYWELTSLLNKVIQKIVPVYSNGTLTGTVTGHDCQTRHSLQTRGRPAAVLSIDVECYIGSLNYPFQRLWYNSAEISFHRLPHRKQTLYYNAMCWHPARRSNNVFTVPTSRESWSCGARIKYDIYSDTTVYDYRISQRDTYTAINRWFNWHQSLCLFGSFVCLGFTPFSKPPVTSYCHDSARL